MEVSFLGTIKRGSKQNQQHYFNFTGPIHAMDLKLIHTGFSLHTRKLHWQMSTMLFNSLL